MAAISKIRKHIWLILTPVALAVIGFMLMDVTTGGIGGGGTPFTMGSINGKKIDYQEFQRQESILNPNGSEDTYGQRAYMWNYMVEEAIINDEAEALGLGVGKEELSELKYGANTSPVMQQNFADPNTGQLNREVLNQYKQAEESNQLPAEVKPFWELLGGQIVKDRLQSKLVNLVSKAIYTPTWQVEMLQNEQNQKVDFLYVKVPFDKVPDAEVKLSDSDFKKYMAENKAKYEQEEETRKVEYVAFDVIPTSGDSARIREDMATIATQWATALNDSSFVLQNRGVNEEAFFKKTDMSPAADTLFQLPVGTIYGPYLDGRSYVVAKVLGTMTIPDSVRARHILIGAKDQTTAMIANKTIDSLKLVIESGKASFDSLAFRYGQDGTRTLGGDLGYSALGKMVKEFNDVIFFKAEQGKLYKVLTQFGVHLVEVTGKKFIANEKGLKAAYIGQNVVPSDDTQKEMYDNAQDFLAKHRKTGLTKAAEADKSIQLVQTPGLKRADYVVGQLGTDASCREIVRWAYGDDLNSKDIEPGVVFPNVFIIKDPQDGYDAKYVVAGLKSIQEKGLPSVAGLKDEIEPFVKNQKKGEVLKTKITGNNLSAVASQYAVPVDTARGASFASSFLPGLGSEPKVLATATNLEVNGVSAPIVGNGGVYLIQTTFKPTDAPAPNNPMIKRQFSMMVAGQVRNGLLKSLQKKADVKDDRSKFF